MFYEKYVQNVILWLVLIFILVDIFVIVDGKIFHLQKKEVIEMLTLKEINDKFNLSCHICHDNIIWSSKTSKKNAKRLMEFLFENGIAFKFDGIQLRSNCSIINGCWKGE